MFRDLHNIACALSRLADNFETYNAQYSEMLALRRYSKERQDNLEKLQRRMGELMIAREEMNLQNEKENRERFESFKKTGVWTGPIMSKENEHTEPNSKA